tara:strand:- start:729 stop:4403 length:3675 start_codon:yes stop_codon:yes gene_type:complete
MAHIRYLEVSNFKSYGGLQKIGEFDRFTAIIGPNGSGKSNLMDAISFVLGVRSDYLRGKGMLDLVHRKVKIQKNCRCFVKLVFMTEEQDIVEMMREIRHDGSTVYSIDGKHITQNEYEQQLERLNILVRIRNFLVFQGDVQNIAQKSPKEITKHIEYISGSEQHIADYNRCLAEKKAAEEKTIINFQLKKTFTAERRQFKAQKDEAIRFKELLDSQAKVKSQLYLFKAYYIEEDLKKRESRLQKSRNDYDNLRNTLEDLHVEMKESKKERAKLLKTQIRLGKELHKLQEAYEKGSPEKVKLQERLRQMKEKISSNRRILEKKEAEHESQKEEIFSLKGELENLRLLVQDYDREWSEKLESYNYSLTSAQEKEYQKLKEDAIQATSQYQQQLSIIENQKEIARQRKQRLDLDHNEMLDRKRRLEDNLLNLEDRQEKVNLQSDRLMKELTECRHKLNEIITVNATAKARQAEVEGLLQDVQEQLQDSKVYERETLKDQRYRTTLAGLKRLFAGVKGRLFDLCKVSQRKYTDAVAVAMGKHANAIVVEDQATALECVRYVKQERLGMYTFLPLDKLPERPIDPALRRLGGTKKLVMDILTFDPSVRRAVSFAIGTTVVCDSLSEARTLCYDESPNQVKCVVTDGTVIHKSGLMSGGVRGIDSKSGRQPNVDVSKLREMKEAYITELAEISRTLRSQTQEEKLKNSIESLENTNSHFVEDLKVTSAKIKENKLELATITKDIKKLEKELKAVQNTIENQDDEDLLRIVADIEKKTFLNFSKKVGIPNIREMESKRLELKREQAREMLKFENQKSRLENQLAFEKQRDVGKAIEKLKACIKKDKAGAKAIEVELESCNVSEEEMKAKRTELQSKILEIRASMQQCTNNISEAKKKIDNLGKESALVNKTISAHESEKYALGIQRRQIARDCRIAQIDIFCPTASDGEEESDMDMSDRLSQSQQLGSQYSQADDRKEPKFEFDFSKLPSSFKKVKTSADFEAKCRELEEKLHAIVIQLERIAPNMRADEHYNTVDNRLKGAVGDFDKAREETRRANEAFEDVKKLRKDAFMEAYEVIKTHIDTIYKELTKQRGGGRQLGGNAFLSLENPDEPYLGGVMYNAMPPHKRFTDLGQLSGGEKTVAALALIFAIHCYRPSPFFVLDEVDAALDPGNVQKVANYIMSQVEEGAFQCIVISLKSSFFENCESLVGVYREQKAECSKVLTVRLSEYD